MKRTLLIICLFANLTCFSQQLPNNLSMADKVYGLSKFWQEVNYNFVYLDQVDRKAWDSTYKALIPQVSQSKNDKEYYRLMARFCAMLKDGHTGVFVPGSVGSLMFGKMFGKYWFSLEEVDGKAIVNRVLKSELNEIPIGTEVISVNGMPTRQYAKENCEPYIFSSTDYVRERYGIQNPFRVYSAKATTLPLKSPTAKLFRCISRTHELQTLLS